MDSFGNIYFDYDAASFEEGSQTLDNYPIPPRLDVEGLMVLEENRRPSSSLLFQDGEDNCSDLRPTPHFGFGLKNNPRPIPMESMIDSPFSSQFSLSNPSSSEATPDSTFSTFSSVGSSPQWLLDSMDVKLRAPPLDHNALYCRPASVEGDNYPHTTDAAVLGVSGEDPDLLDSETASSSGPSRSLPVFGTPPADFRNMISASARLNSAPVFPPYTASRRSSRLAVAARYSQFTYLEPSDDEDMDERIEDEDVPESSRQGFERGIAKRSRKGRTRKSDLDRGNDEEYLEAPQMYHPGKRSRSQVKRINKSDPVGDDDQERLRKRPRTGSRNVARDLEENYPVGDEDGKRLRKRPMGSTNVVRGQQENTFGGENGERSRKRPRRDGGTGSQNVVRGLHENDPDDDEDQERSRKRPRRKVATESLNVTRRSGRLHQNDDEEFVDSSKGKGPCPSTVKSPRTTRKGLGNKSKPDRPARPQASPKRSLETIATCSVPGCGQTFTRRHDLKRHMQTVTHGRKLSKAQLRKIFLETDETQRRWCEHCYSTLARADSRRRHENRVHKNLNRAATAESSESTDSE